MIAIIKYFKRFFCKHRFAYNYKKKYYRCRNCHYKINNIVKPKLIRYEI